LAESEQLPSESGVYRALVRLNLIDPSGRRRRDRRWKRWERGEPMELWQMDVVGGFVIADRDSTFRAKALTGVDDHARFCVSAHLMVRESSQRVCDGLALALRKWGVPEQILTDNGKVFTGRFNTPQVEVLFDRICRENGIEHLLTKPRSPTTTGKIERFHRALRTEFRTDRVFASLQQAQAELDAWVEEYNHRRPHQALDMATPAERFLRPEKASVTPLRDLVTVRGSGRPAEDQPGGTWVARRATRVGVVCVNWQQVCLGIAAAGRNIDVWVTDQVLQFYDGDHLLRTEKRTTTGEVRKKRAQASRQAT
jgi:transposase InsO family protein